MDDDSNPNYWSSSVSCSPSMIDREVASLINTKMYCRVGLNSLASDTETLEIGLLGCYNSLNNSLAYVSAVNLLNAEPGITDPYLMIELISDPMRISGLGFYCTLSIFSRAGTRITSNPEFENVSIAVQFYNMPLGEISDSVQDKIDEAKDFSFLLGDWLGTLQNILNYGEKICKLINTIMKIYGMVGIVGGILSGFEETPVVGENVYPGRVAVQEAQSGIGQLGKEGWKGFINQFCKFFSCRLFYDDIWGLGDTSIGQALGDWQRKVMETADWVAVGGFLGGSNGTGAYPERIGIGGESGVHAWTNSRTGYEIIIKGGGVLNPKDSIVMSTLTLCIPGIVYNLNKLRQIQCMYADCMINYVQQGLPLKACEDQKHYATCKYWYGEIFQLLPFTGLLSFFGNVIKNALSSPLAIVDAAVGVACMSIIPIPKSGFFGYACLTNDVLGLVADIWSDLEGVFDSDYWKFNGGDYCDRIEDSGEEEEKKDEDK